MFLMDLDGRDIACGVQNGRLLTVYRYAGLYVHVTGSPKPCLWALSFSRFCRRDGKRGSCFTQLVGDKAEG